MRIPDSGPPGRNGNANRCKFSASFDQSIIIVRKSSDTVRAFKVRQLAVEQRWWGSKGGGVRGG